MPFGMGALKGVGNAMMNAPGMSAIRKPLQAGMKAPGMKPVAKGLGLGPSNQAAPQQKMQPPQQGPALGQQGPMQNAVGQVGAAMGQAFGRPQPNQQAWQNMAQAGAGIGGAFGMGKMYGGAPPMMAPEPSAPASPDMQNQENTPEMMQAKQNQMAQMFGNQLGGMFGGGMARPQAMMGQAAPDESMDAMRRNKFMQMRQGGIGPRFGMRPPQQPIQQMQQEPEQQY